MTKPRNRQRVVLNGFAELGTALQVPGHKDPSTHVPEAPLGALPVIDDDAIESLQQDPQGNISVVISTTAKPLHPAMQAESTMTITTGQGTYQPGPAHTPPVNNVTALPTATATQGNQAMQSVNTVTSSSNASVAAVAVPTGTPSQMATYYSAIAGGASEGEALQRAGLAQVIHQDASGPTVAVPGNAIPVPVATAAPAVETARRARRLFRAEPEGNFDEGFQASQDLSVQTASLRQRVALHSQHLAVHDAEIDDLRQDMAELTKTVNDNAKRAPASGKKSDWGDYAETAAVGAATAAGIVAGVAIVGVACDWLFDTNIVTLPKGDNT